MSGITICIARARVALAYTVGAGVLFVRFASEILAADPARHLVLTGVAIAASLLLLVVVGEFVASSTPPHRA